MTLLKAAVAFYVLGTLIFLMQANLELSGEPWTTFYYIWAKGKDVLFFTAIAYLLKPEQRWIIKPLIIYATINLLWELINPLTNLSVNHPGMVTIVFTILILIVIIYLLRDLRTHLRKDL